MVVFTCNFCGDSVKKPKAEKHITLECKRKRNGCASLCCIDCLKDFDVQTYNSHTKCMTEEERYSAPGFVPKPSSCKGERKQSSWIDTIQSVLKKPNLKKHQKLMLQSISSFENIPRKKNKFINFIRNSAGYGDFDSHVLEEVFNLIESEFKTTSTSTETKVTNPAKEENLSTNVSHELKHENVNHDHPIENGKAPKIVKQKKKKDKKNNNLDEESSKPFEKENTEPQETPSDAIEESHLAEKCIVNGCDVNQNEDESFTEVKKSKKKKKEIKNADIPMEIATDANLNVEDVEMKVESTSNDVSFQNDTEFAMAKSKGKKKHKNKENISVDDTIEAPVNENFDLVNPDEKIPAEENTEKKPEKKKKKKRKLDQDETEDDVSSKRSRIETTENKISPKKFSWEDVVKTMLVNSKDHEMSVKRMTKKVVAEYQSSCSKEKSFEEIEKKFNKKVKKLPFVIVSKDRIQLYVE